MQKSSDNIHTDKYQMSAAISSGTDEGIWW